MQLYHFLAVVIVGVATSGALGHSFKCKSSSSGRTREFDFSKAEAVATMRASGTQAHFGYKQYPHPYWGGVRDILQPTNNQHPPWVDRPGHHEHPPKKPTKLHFPQADRACNAENRQLLLAPFVPAGPSDLNTSGIDPACQNDGVGHVLDFVVYIAEGPTLCGLVTNGLEYVRDVCAVCDFAVCQPFE